MLLEEKPFYRLVGKKFTNNHLEEEDESDDLKEQILPRIEKGDTLNINLIAQTSGQTKPPARFNEATFFGNGKSCEVYGNPG